MAKGKVQEVHLVKRLKDKGYRIVKLVNCVRVANVGRLDVGEILNRPMIEEMVETEVRVIVSEEWHPTNHNPRVSRSLRRNEM